MRFIKGMALGCLAVLCFAPCAAQEKKGDGAGLFPVVQNGKWGYMDRSGKVVIAPQFDEARRFSEGLAAVESKSGQWGYIDQSGQLVIKPQFYYAANFSEGLARVRLAGKYGYIDAAGQIVIAPQFEEVSVFWMVELDTKVKAGDFSEGLAVVVVNDKAGYIDKTGKVVIEPQFNVAHPFFDGLANVEITFAQARSVGAKGVSRFIDHAGHVVIDQINGRQFTIAESFSEGLAAVRVNGELVYVDNKGKIVIPPLPSDALAARQFTEGLAAVQIGSKWGYMDRSGKVVIRPQFDMAFPFSEGIARIAVFDKDGIIDKYGYIDKSGRTVVAPQFYDADDFSGGLAFVKINGARGYIDKAGKYVWKPTK